MILLFGMLECYLFIFVLVILISPCSPLREVSAQGCGKDWLQNDDQCYQIVPYKKSWTDARLHCHSKGGDLAVIPDKETSVRFDRDRGVLGLPETGTP